MAKTHNWCLKFRDGFREQFYKLDKKTRTIGFRQIQQLLEAENPLSPPKVLKIKNAIGIYRVRIGNYRLLFSLDVGDVICENYPYKGILWLEDIADRKDVYKNLD
jgi:mRNA-degrading endonuclease RelE of RelBE toxin-antitoxin system